MTNHPETRPSFPPVAVTGLGLATSLGRNVEENWRNMLAGKCGFAGVERFDVATATLHDGGNAHPLPMDRDPGHDADGRERSLAYLEIVAEEALRDAGLWQDGAATFSDPTRTALVLGSSLASSASSDTFWNAYIQEGGVETADYARLQSYDIEPMLDQLCRRFGIRGEAILVANACAAGGSAVAMGWEMLQAGEADHVLVLGSDSLEMHTFAGFHSLSLLTPDPELRPFQPDRKGMKLGDGFAAMVLQREPDALADGRRIHARLTGVGESGDAHSLTQPHPEGYGAALAMRRALGIAGRKAEDVDYVNLHATCTPSNDVSEYGGLKSLLGERLSEVRLQAVKPSIGHTLGAAGTVDAVFTVKVLEDRVIPKTLGLVGELEYEGARFCAENEQRPVRCAITNSFGFGGANAALVFEPVGGDA